jgi:hypothetical protein
MDWKPGRRSGLALIASPDGGAAAAPDGLPASILEFDASTGHPLRPTTPPSAVGGKPVQEVRLNPAKPGRDRARMVTA